MRAAPFLFLFALLSAAGPIRAAKPFYRAPEGFTEAKDLPAGFSARIRAIRFDRRGPFEGTAAYTSVEKWGYALLSRLHVNTREGTVRRRLLFEPGAEIDRERLLETERALRVEEFISDAYVAAGPIAGGSCDVVVTTFDQWTTVPGGGPKVLALNADNLLHWRWDKILGEEWYWWAGISESNLAGTGTRLGGAYRHDPLRNTLEATLSNMNVTPWRLQATGYLAALSDGHLATATIARPLLSRSDRYAFSVLVSSQESAERIWFDANGLDTLPDSLARRKAGAPHELRVFESVATREATAWAVKAWGTDSRFTLGPTFQYKEHYDLGGLGRPDSSLPAYAPLPASALEPEKRKDVLAGMAASLFRTSLHTARNFRNLKWTESVEAGWRLTAKAAVNQAWLGAGDSDFRLHGEAVGAGLWDERLWLNGSGAWQSFVAPSGRLTDGQFDASGEAAWKQVPLTATWLTASWTNLISTPASVQLPLGELNGLNGFPSYYFAGQARFLASAEQRLFPEWEWITMVPAFSAFVTAGNTFPQWREFDPENLHWSAGFGLRLGRSKSTQKLVQHWNVNFPLNEPLLPGVVISVLAKKSL